MSFYKIKKTDRNFILALAKYCKDVPISTIENATRKTVTDVTEEKYTLKDLPKLINNEDVIPWAEFVITCPESYSDTHVFPPMDPHFFASLPEAESKEDCALLDKNIFDSYFVHETYKGPKTLMIFGPIQSPLSETLALLLLKQINDKYPVTNGMLFANLKTILFEVDSKFYCLRFGEQAKFDKIAHLMFDLEDGFQVPAWPADNQAKFAFIVDELNARFTSWKDGGYVGDFIPLDQTGFIEAAQVRPAIQAPVAAARFFAQAPIPSASEAPQQEEREDLGFNH